MADDISFFVACDYVIQDSATGKISLVGLFDNLLLDKLPARPASPWFLFAKIIDLGSDERNLTVEISEVAEGEVIFETGIRIPSDHGTSVNIIVGAQPAEFRNWGPHEAILSLDGAEVARLRFDVKEIGQKPKG